MDGESLLEINNLISELVSFMANLALPIVCFYGPFKLYFYKNIEKLILAEGLAKSKSEAAALSSDSHAINKVLSNKKNSKLSKIFNLNIRLDRFFTIYFSVFIGLSIYEHFK